MAVCYSICISLNQLLLSEMLLKESVVLVCLLQTRDTQAAFFVNVLLAHTGNICLYVEK